MSPVKNAARFPNTNYDAVNGQQANSSQVRTQSPIDITQSDPNATGDEFKKTDSGSIPATQSDKPQNKQEFYNKKQIEETFSSLFKKYNLKYDKNYIEQLLNRSFNDDLSVSQKEVMALYDCLNTILENAKTNNEEINILNAISEAKKDYAEQKLGIKNDEKHYNGTNIEEILKNENCTTIEEYINKLKQKYGNENESNEKLIKDIGELLVNCSDEEKVKYGAKALSLIKDAGFTKAFMLSFTDITKAQEFANQYYKDNIKEYDDMSFDKNVLFIVGTFQNKEGLTENKNTIDTNAQEIYKNAAYQWFEAAQQNDENIPEDIKVILENYDNATSEEKAKYDQILQEAGAKRLAEIDEKATKYGIEKLSEDERRLYNEYLKVTNRRSDLTIVTVNGRYINNTEKTELLQEISAEAAKCEPFYRRYLENITDFANKHSEDMEISRERFEQFMNEATKGDFEIIQNKTNAELKMPKKAFEKLKNANIKASGSSESASSSDSTAGSAIEYSTKPAMGLQSLEQFQTPREPEQEYPDKSTALHAITTSDENASLQFDTVAPFVLTDDSQSLYELMALFDEDGRAAFNKFESLDDSTKISVYKQIDDNVSLKIALVSALPFDFLNEAYRNAGNNALKEAIQDRMTEKKNMKLT